MDTLTIFIWISLVLLITLIYDHYNYWKLKRENFKKDVTIKQLEDRISKLIKQ